MKKLLLSAGLVISIFTLHFRLSAQSQATLSLPSNRVGVATLAFEDVILHRIALRLTTSQIEGSENDEGVYVQMNEKDEKFYLAKGIDNFKRGQQNTYDFLSSSINHIHDIQFIKLGVKGSDGWRVTKLELFFNNNNIPIYSRTYAGDGLLLDNAGSTTIPGRELRASNNWNFNNDRSEIWKRPQVIPKTTIISLVEAAIGNQMVQGTSFRWGTTSGIDTRWGPVVEVAYKNDSTLHFDLDLQRVINGPNPEVDIDFDLVFKCENGVIQISTRNIEYGTNYVGSIQTWLREDGIVLLGKAIGGFLGQPQVGEVAGGIVALFIDYGIKLNPGEVAANGSCHKINILENGNIQL